MDDNRPRAGTRGRRPVAALAVAALAVAVLGLAVAPIDAPAGSDDASTITVTAPAAAPTAAQLLAELAGPCGPVTRNRLRTDEDMLASVSTCRRPDAVAAPFHGAAAPTVDADG